MANMPFFRFIYRAAGRATASRGEPDGSFVAFAFRLRSSSFGGRGRSVSHDRQVSFRQ
jgi:hypothetical protein